MFITTKTNCSRRGVAIVEFSLSLVFLTPLLLGTLVFGFRLIRSIEMTQITRDLGHMYLRGINFRDAIPKANAQTMAAQYNLTAGGTCLILLSQVRIATQADCDAAVPASPGNNCINRGKAVFVEQVTLGNAGNGKSAFGQPPLDSGQKVSTVDLGTNSNAQAKNFSAALSLNVGESAYVAEMINLTPELNIPGMTGATQVYARTIF